MNILSSTRREELIRSYLLDDRTEMCEHVEAGERALAVFSEDDSFGPVMRYAACDACTEKAEEEQNAEMKYCRDCAKTHRRDAGRFWRWYDFYAAQGDEALFVCNACWSAPKHKGRMADDLRRSREEDAWYARRRGFGFIDD